MLTSSLDSLSTYTKISKETLQTVQSGVTIIGTLTIGAVCLSTLSEAKGALSIAVPVAAFATIFFSLFERQCFIIKQALQQGRISITNLGFNGINKIRTIEREALHKLDKPFYPLPSFITSLVTQPYRKEVAQVADNGINSIIGNCRQNNQKLLATGASLMLSSRDLNELQTDIEKDTERLITFNASLKNLTETKETPKETTFLKKLESLIYTPFKFIYDIGDFLISLAVEILDSISQLFSKKELSKED